VYRCDRCKAMFNDKKGVEELKRHRQASDACDLRPYEDMWGVDEETLNNMRPRKGITREERWQSLYRHIFQLDLAVDVPSPCKLNDIHPPKDHMLTINA
jgi:hypothetical protein